MYEPILIVSVLLLVGITASKIQSKKDSCIETLPIKNNRKGGDLMYLVKVQVIRGGISGAIGGALQVITLMWLRTLTSYQYRYGVPFTIAMSELYADGGVGR